MTMTRTVVGFHLYHLLLRLMAAADSGHCSTARMRPFNDHSQL
jgi:hypothetical protein